MYGLSPFPNFPRRCFKGTVSSVSQIDMCCVHIISYFIFFRILRREPELTQFETAQIANLCPADAEEAKSIIPSLVKIEDDRLQALLDEIQAMRKFQT